MIRYNIEIGFRIRRIRSLRGKKNLNARIVERLLLAEYIEKHWPQISKVLPRSTLLIGNSTGHTLATLTQTTTRRSATKTPTWGKYVFSADSAVPVPTKSLNQNVDVVKIKFNKKRKKWMIKKEKWNKRR